MSESILQEWEKEARAYTEKFHYKNFAPGGTVGRTAELTDQVLALLARDRIMREALKFISEHQFYSASADSKHDAGEMNRALIPAKERAQKVLAEADKILETTNKGEP